ncbi:LytTR family DNA-binding domain-containing protein [Terrimonas sp. NA20]|uniref:LytTR family DNA-binding domain-containing protein n=1 Tax=Terrimonas ginsenosidimutans TaxID=2908004 RepID=A0ABS9KU49_9BACT|nr:LytTR family DNA-binding domain-containing protein [Terrimonas ginsenosidimutans]MCG2615848.1 LytTR family DNA-binding domain-containing protein [Terrimonas ginsenosidimutans]
MTLKKVLIIDDEEASRTIIRQYLEDHPEIEIAGECHNGIEAVTLIDEVEPDLVFLDIQMPGCSGFQVLRKIIHVPQIIFSTAFDRYALKAFDSNAVDYLLKPYTKERFEQALSKIIRQGNSTESIQNLAQSTGSVYYDKILLENGNKMISIHISDITYLEAEKDYTRVFTNDKNYLSNFGISIIEQKLNPSNFTRIHRSHIININQIHEVYRENGDTYLVLKTQQLFKVSKSYTDNIRKMMY